MLMLFVAASELLWTGGPALILLVTTQYSVYSENCWDLIKLGPYRSKVWVVVSVFVVF